MTFVLVFLVYAQWPDVRLSRYPTWDACQAAGFAAADVALRERKRAWFKCLDVAGNM